MNPFSRSLLKRLNDRRLSRFVEYWDELEALIIRMYKSGSNSVEDQAEYHRVRTWISSRYAAWRPALSSYWPRTRVGGEALQADPFETILAIETVEEIPGNWRTMQILPAAREALNQFLLDQIGE